MRPGAVLISSFLLTSLLHGSTAYEMFQMKIPNGNIVPFPCKPGEYWRGVGHIVSEGTGTRNPFGRDFETAGYEWTKELCKMDSDGDGVYNGLELGDPNCEWKPGKRPKTSEAVTHPGICEPFDSMYCNTRPIISPKYQNQQAWLKDMCQSGAFNCPAMNDKNLMNVTARFSRTEIPPQLTSYFCQIYSLADLGVPMDKDFHMIAVTPVIDNSDVVHHIVLFGCTDKAVPSSRAFECGMKPDENCQEFMHVWTIGLAGECYHPESGIRVGKTGYKYVAFQVHWTNIKESTGIMDNSGLTLHYTPNMKRFDAGVFVLGSALFYLPPKQERVIVNSTCAGGCTKKILVGSIYITAAWNHMHYAGKTMAIEVVRNNQHLSYLTMDRLYNYDSPQVMMFSDPVEIRPGDAIITQCGFTTKGRNKTIAWGDGTLDEMCFGFITYYPKQNMVFQYCLDKLGVSSCDIPSLQGCANIGKFLMMINATEAYVDVTNNCRLFSPCLYECVETILKQMQKEPCLRGQIWEFIQSQLSEVPKGPGHDFLCRLASCKAEVQMALNSQSMPGEAAGRPGTASLAVTVISSLTISVQFYLSYQIY